MALGGAFLWLAAACLAAAFVSYILPLNNGVTISPSKGAAYGRDGRTRVSRLLYVLSAVFLTAASGVLLALLLGRRFDVAYVSAFTSRDLPTLYVFSAFWAGPEGSFLLWALVGGWAGVFLSRTARDLEAPAMACWCLAQGILLAMLVAHSPFMTGVPGATDGQGMNPVLQDPWMAIHPPVLFLGFVAATAPACLAAAALLTGKPGKWAVCALPWASFAWLALGAGLTLGALWAYEVLGWGGFWGWDPVENSSLVPWLTGTVLLHGLVIQKRKGVSQRANVIFALLTYLLVLYSTFLTRSGVLGDFSVHSFSDLGVGGLLAGMVGAVALAFALLLTVRWRALPAPDIVERPDGREANHYAAVWLLSAMALVVLAGTSAPIITRSALVRSLLGLPATAGVQPHFYNSTAGPLMAGVLFLIAVCPPMLWTVRGEQQARPSGWLGLSAVIAVAMALALVFLAGPSRGLLYCISALGAAALAVNAFWFARSATRTGALAASYYLAHAGVALMFVGIGASSLGGPAVPVLLTSASPEAQALKWRVRLGGVQAESPAVMAAALTLTSPSGDVRQVVLRGKQGPGGGYAFKPCIARGPLQDVYFAPREITPKGPPISATHAKRIPGTVELIAWMEVGPGGLKGSPVSSPDGGVTVTLKGMQVENHAVVLQVASGGGAPEEITIARGETLRAAGCLIQFVDFGKMEQGADGGMRASAIVAVAPQSGRVPAGAFAQAAAAASGGTVSLEVSRKPLMGVLWLGAAIAGLGALLAVVRRFREVY